MKKDTSVELARLLACFIVIGVHTKLSVIGDCVGDFSRLYICCILADGVAVFWMITGFFLFQNTSYRKVLRHTWKRVGIPLIAFSLFVFYFRDWLIGGETLAASLCHTPAEYLEVGKKLLTWTNPIGHTNHLWYLYVYILLMLIFPVLKGLVSYLDAKPVRIKYFLAASLVILILNDISCNQLCEFSHHAINGLIPAAMEVIWGYYIYRYRERFRDRRYILLSLCAFFGLNAIRGVLQMQKFEMANPDNYLLYWHSLFGVVCAVCILIFCFSVVGNREKINRVICFFASYTFPVYLIHIVVRDALRRAGLPSGLYEGISGVFPDFFGEILYTVIIVALVFVISFVIAVVLRRVCRLFSSFRSA